MNEEVIKAEDSPKGSIADEVRQFVADGGSLEDVVKHGCDSGSVPGLIYYRDTLVFFSRHREEIERMLANLIDATGCSANRLFKNWDREDPLANETCNQNLLTWYAFREVAQELLEGD